jgi:ankyrin
VTPLALRRALDTLPPTLDDTYSRILQSIPGEQRDDAMRLLQWLVYSNESLRPEEAVDAIAVNLAAKPYFDPKHRTPIPSDIILSCSGLMVIERVYDKRGRCCGDVLQLAHFSIQQYLKSEKVDLDWKQCMCEDHAVANNVKLCLAYCFSLEGSKALEDSEDRDDSDDFYHLREHFPFTSTASKYWTQYAMYFEAQDQQLYEMIQDFLLPDKLSMARQRWLCRFLDDNLVLDRGWHRKKFGPKKLVPLTIASACGLYKSVKSLLLSGANPNELCPVWGTALCAASYRGHYNIIELLLKHDARPNLSTDRAELSLAMSSPRSTQRSEVFHALLQHDADVNACDESVGFPLASAVACGDEEIVNTLLAKGAEVNAVDNQQRIAIQVAAFNGYDTIVRKLLEHKADVNLSGGIALISACSKGHREVIRTLLKNGAIICQRPELQCSRNALEAACYRDDEESLELLLEHLNDPTILGQCFGLACGSGKIDLVKILLKHKAEVNRLDDRGQTPLYYAVLSDRSESSKLIDILIEAGAVLDNVDKRGQTPVMEAVIGGTVKIYGARIDVKGHLEVLLRAGAKTNVQNVDGKTALLQASKYGELAACKLLIDAGAKTEVQDVNGRAALHYAAKYKELAICTMLVEAGAKIETQDFINSNTALHYAVKNGDLDICTMLLEARAKTDIQALDGNTALHYAAWDDCLEICAMLVEAGVDIDIQGKHGKTALLQAAKFGQLAACKMLIEAGAKTDIQEKNRETALHRAARSSCLELCTMLVAAGADTTIQNASGEIALHIAAALGGQLSMCRVLIEAGANINVQDNAGYTALHCAAWSGHLEICTILVDANVEVNIQGNNGETALHVAALGGRLSVCDLLMGAGANLDACNDRGLTPLQVAEEKNNSEVVALFKSHFQREELGTAPPTE